MSHFSTVKTELRQLEPLVQALNDLGYSPDQGSVQSVGTAARPSPPISPSPCSRVVIWASAGTAHGVL